MTRAAEAPRGVRLPRPERRAQLLDAARQVFVERGYHATAMDDVAEQAGVSKPVLYQHFPGKLDLYLALVDAQARDLVDGVRAALASTQDNEQRVRRAITAYYTFVTADPAHRLILESDLRSEPAVRDLIAAAQAGCVDAIAATIIEDTGVHDDEAHLLASGLTGMAEVSARWWLAAHDSGSAVGLDRAVDLLALLGWRGISGSPVRAAGGS